MTISTLWTIWKDSDIDDTQIIFNDQIIPVKVVEGWFEIFKKKGGGGGGGVFFKKRGGGGGRGVQNQENIALPSFKNSRM